MRNPVVVLKNLSEKSHNSQYKYERLYRNLYNQEFYLLAYNNIAKSQGSMTPGIDGKTLSNMSMGRIDSIIATIRDHSYQPKPARRKYIEKKNSNKKRPLGISSTDDKLVQEVVRMILESIYEKTFADNSHGFRPKRSCQTALAQMQCTFTGVKWFVEGDIKACFDSFDHHVLIGILRKRIHDEYFISLIWKFLKAGYMEQWEYNKTYSGTPQGSGISPILANIYLNELDRYMAEYKESFDTENARGRKISREYRKIGSSLYRAKKRYEKKWQTLSKQERIEASKHIKIMRSERQKLDTYPVHDHTYKRIQYVRYADDFLVGIIGSKQDAMKAKTDIKKFLAERLKLELSEEKTKVTHSTEKVRFLAYDIAISRNKSIKYNKNGVPNRYHSGKVLLYVPKEKWFGKLRNMKLSKSNM